VIDGSSRLLAERAALGLDELGRLDRRRAVRAVQARFFYRLIGTGDQGRIGGIVKRLPAVKPNPPGVIFAPFIARQIGFTERQIVVDVDGLEHFVDVGLPKFIVASTMPRVPGWHSNVPASKEMSPIRRNDELEPEMLARR
jgi:hypothetical protein